jgi:hypothetical protein
MGFLQSGPLLIGKENIRVFFCEQLMRRCIPLHKLSSVLRRLNLLRSGEQFDIEFSEF